VNYLAIAASDLSMETGNYVDKLCQYLFIDGQEGLPNYGRFGVANESFVLFGIEPQPMEFNKHSACNFFFLRGFQRTTIRFHDGFATFGR